VVIAERAATVLRDAHPDVEPFEVDWPTLADWVAQAGIDPDNDVLVAAALVAWEQLL
jgi:Fe-S-cluster formation regulator IscX/YfhJ